MEPQEGLSLNLTPFPKTHFKSNIDKIPQLLLTFQIYILLSFIKIYQNMIFSWTNHNIEKKLKLNNMIETN